MLNGSHVEHKTLSKKYQTPGIELCVNPLLKAAQFVTRPEKLINFLITIFVNQLLRGL